ncbi:hypothetical protein [Ornithinimicrobium kibberense]|uniref:hypothetical protein n=1 Tax=Ornithinimicrobium kibberense TaxID=282060 RepID=UPI00360A79B8
MKSLTTSGSTRTVPALSWSRLCGRRTARNFQRSSGPCRARVSETRRVYSPASWKNTSAAK